LTEILALALAGKLEYFVRMPGGHGLQALRFDVDEIRSIIRGSPLTDLTAERLSEVLKTSDRVVKALISHEVLSVRTVINPMNRCPVKVVPRDEVESFRQTHCTIFDLMRETGVHFLVAKQKIKAAKINPQLESERFFVDFYRRSDLAGIEF
jgi:hypothetical protein